MSTRTAQPQLVSQSKAVISHGPVFMAVEAWRRGDDPHARAALAGAARAAELLEELVPWLEIARLPISDPRCRVTDEQPLVLRRMIGAVARLGEPDFTPMAAVAGCFSDLAKEAAMEAGADRVLTNNGGDISMAFGRAGTPFTVGLVSDLNSGTMSHTMEIAPGEGIRGLATSGQGGRSLSKGVVSAVTCLAQTCAAADAAATSVANAAWADDPAVEYCRAEELDPLTDLKGHTVVRKVGVLPDKAMNQALAAGARRADVLLGSGMIQGAVIFLQGRYTCMPAGLGLHPVITPQTDINQAIAINSAQQAIER